MSKFIQTIVEDDLYYCLAVIVMSLSSFGIGLLIGLVWML